MAGAVTTSLVVQFGSDEDEQYHLSAEIDSREDGHNEGVTQFYPGDTPAYLVYSSPELSLQFFQSLGSSDDIGTVSIATTEYIVFANESEANLAKPPSGGVSITSLGGDGGTAVHAGGTKLILKKNDKPYKGVAVFKVDYTARPRAFRMAGIPLEVAGENIFPVVVVIVGTAGI